MYIFKSNIRTCEPSVLLLGELGDPNNDTKEEKIAKIREMKCDYFVDDLEEIILSLGQKTKGILYDPQKTSEREGNGELTSVMTRWRELSELVNEN